MHRFRRGTRAFSSAGSEHLPYKQRVGGSNPSTPTKFSQFLVRKVLRAFSSAGSEHLPYKQRVGGSNPSTPTTASDNIGCFFVLQKKEEAPTTQPRTIHPGGNCPTSPTRPTCQNRPTRLTSPTCPTSQNRPTPPTPPTINKKPITCQSK